MTTQLNLSDQLHDRASVYTLLSGGSACAICIVTVVALLILTAGVLSTGGSLLLLAGAGAAVALIYQAGKCCTERAELDHKAAVAHQVFHSPKFS